MPLQSSRLKNAPAPAHIPLDWRSAAANHRCAMGTLYYGDNLEILRRYLKDETIDLVYLDPPFNSAQNYNAFFHEKDGTDAASQIRAFEDTWTWNQESQRVYEDLILQPGKVSEVMQAFRTFLGTNDMMAYLAMMAPRLVELRRVLKSTGSLYLHCDPTASHYLKLLCDAILGKENFRNEIIWKRTTAKSLAFRNLPNNHDVLLLYSKGEEFVWNRPFKPYDFNNLDEKTEKKYSYRDSDGRRYTLGDLNNPNPDRPNLTYEFLGHHKVWRWTKDRMEQAYKAGIVVQPSPGAVPRLKRYLDEQEGKPLDDVWSDIPPSIRRRKSVSATRHKSQLPYLNESLRKVPIPATWFSTPSAAAARRSTPPKNSAANGSALT